MKEFGKIAIKGTIAGGLAYAGYRAGGMLPFLKPAKADSFDVRQLLGAVAGGIAGVWIGSKVG